MFGINGFVMGPLVAALFMAFWGIFIREFGQYHYADPANPENGPARED
jgi:predicted PurR-regulated permease PerM